MEWRFSCSLAETVLMQNLPPICHAVYIITKVALSDHITSFETNVYKPANGISTYHLKNIFLWKCENRHPDTWRKEDICEIVGVLFQKYKTSIEKCSLRHYFFPQRNLFSRLSKQYCSDITRDQRTDIMYISKNTCMAFLLFLCSCSF